MSNKILEDNETVNIDQWKDLGFTTDKEVDNNLINNYNFYYEKLNERMDLVSSIEDYQYSPKFLENDFNTDFSKYLKYYVPNKKDYFYYTNKIFAKEVKVHKGYVTKINEDTFEARIYNSDLQGTYELAEFDLKDVDNDDNSLFSLGAIFYWTFGYYSVNGQIEKKSKIRFQRLVQLDSDEFEDVMNKVDELNDELNWE